MTRSPEKNVDYEIVHEQQQKKKKKESSGVSKKEKTENDYEPVFFLMDRFCEMVADKYESMNA